MFIPFLGAVVAARSLGNNALAEARVGLAGPVLGSIGAAACVLVWHATGNDLWRALAFTGFFLNLFNLLPGRAARRRARDGRDGARGCGSSGSSRSSRSAIVFPNPIILLILIFAGFETYRRWKQRRAGGAEQQAYYRVRPLDRALVAGVYLSLVALLVVGMHATLLARTIS